MDITTQTNKDILDVQMSGKFTFSDHQVFRPVLERMSAREIRSINFHMNEVEFIDSAALGMLLLANDEAGKHNKGINIVGAQGQVLKMFDMARFNALFTML